jgi:catechol 2,3-dioxygenase-like lactoylglutathione lyase family enzyme
VTDPIVRALDHVFVPVRDPAPLFELFTGPLGLPVAWPIHDYGDFRSGGVCLGNANIEFVTGDPARFPFFAPTEPLTARGIAFDPADAGGLPAALDQRKLRHTDPIAHEGTGASGHSGPLWTNVFLSGMAARAAVVFVCHYHVEESLRGERAREAMHACGGGALGVRGLSEVTLGVSDHDAALDRWTRFLAPFEPDAHGAFHIGGGPVVRLKPSPIDGVAGLWLEVASLDRARDALAERDLLGPMRRSGIGLDYARTGGLDVWLSEAR